MVIARIWHEILSQRVYSMTSFLYIKFNNTTADMSSFNAGSSGCVDNHTLLLRIRSGRARDMLFDHRQENGQRLPRSIISSLRYAYFDEFHQNTIRGAASGPFEKLVSRECILHQRGFQPSSSTTVCTAFISTYTHLIGHSKAEFLHYLWAAKPDTWYLMLQCISWSTSTRTETRLVMIY